MKTLLFSLIIFAIISCKSEPGNNIIKYSQIYVDILIVEETYRGMPDSLVANKSKIYENYGTTEENYNEGLRSMEETSEEWNLFFNNTLTYLDSLKKKGNPVKIDSLKVQP